MVYMYHSFLVHSSADGHLGWRSTFLCTNLLNSCYFRGIWQFNYFASSHKHFHLSNLPVFWSRVPLCSQKIHNAQTIRVFGHSYPLQYSWGFPGSSDSKESACNAGDPGWIPGSGRSPGKGNGNPLQCSYLGNSIARGAWRATVHRVTKSQTWLSD